LSNPVDSVNSLYTVIQSGLVVSGNTNMQVVKQVTSGDNLTSARMSGTGGFEYIALRLSRNEPMPLVGGTFTHVTDYVEANIYIHYPYGPAFNTSSVLSNLVQRVKDFKTTVYSGTWTNPAKPFIAQEEWPQPHEKVAKAKLVYRFRYLL